MKKYEAFKQELIEHILQNFSQSRETLDIPYLLKGQCGTFATAMAGYFPELRVVTGFYCGRVKIDKAEEDPSCLFNHVQLLELLP
jgi:hypothetical protein